MGIEEAEPPTTDSPREQAWSRVRELGDRVYRVELGGPLRPGWMASLGLELSLRDLSVDRANGRRGPRGAWTAVVDVVRMPQGADPMSLSYVDLADSGRIAETSQLLCLERFTVTESAFHGGCIELDFEARDSLGLLGRVLAELTLLRLFPVVLRIETRAGHVHDRLWLTGENGPPSDDACQRLQTLLARQP